MRNRTRMIAAAAAATAALAGSTAAAVASTTGAKPGAPAKTVSASKTCTPDSELAAQLGVSSAHLDQALRAAKISLSKSSAKPTEDRFDATLARILGMPQARIQRAFARTQCVSAPAGSKLTGSKSVGSQSGAQPGSEALGAAVARELHVSTVQVNAALRPIFAAGYADPSSPVFAAAAHSLGVSTQQLATALTHAKQSMAGGS